MAAATGTLAAKTEFAGDYKILVITATLTTTSDTITLTAANHGGVVSIEGILGATINTGMAATFASLQVSSAGLVVTVVSKNEAGIAATTWGNITVALLVKHTS